MMNTAFTVGVVLTAQNLYSGVIAKAQRDITMLGKVSQVQADAFSASLAKWQKVGAIGIGITAASYKVAGVFEGLVAEAGSAEAAVGKAFIQMGDQGGLTRDQLARAFSAIQTTWGIANEQTSAALGQAGGRLGDYAKGLGMVQVAATLSAARQMDLATSTDIVTTLFQQFGNTITGVSTDQDKFKVIASEVSTALRSAGGDTGELGAILGTFAIKAAGAGQSLETVLGLIATLGASGAGPRFAMGIMQLFDKMSEGRMANPAQFAEWYPTTARTGNAIDFLGEIQQRLVALGATDAKTQFDLLNASFGEAAPAISFLLTHMDQLTAKVNAQSAAGKDLTAVERQAEEQMGTWDGVQKRLTGRVGEFKEMLGSGALPVVKAFDKGVGSFLTTMTGAPQVFKTFLAGGVGLVGLAAEAGKIAGPGMTALATFGTYRQLAGIAKALRAAVSVGEESQYLTGPVLGGLQAGAAGARVAAGGGSLAAQSSVAAGALGMGSGGLAAAAVVAAAALGVLALGVYAASQPGKERPAGEFVPGGETQWQYEGLKPITPGKMLTPAQQYAQSYLGPGITPVPATGLFGTGRSVRDIATSMPKFAEGGPVGSTGLALVHEGEYVLPKRTVRDLFRSSASRPQSSVLSPQSSALPSVSGDYNAPGSRPSITVNLPSFQATGNLDYDSRAFARAVLRVLSRDLPTELKAQARRYA
jgi:hypothetical protein